MANERPALDLSDGEENKRQSLECVSHGLVKDMSHVSRLSTLSLTSCCLGLDQDSGV